MILYPEAKGGGIIDQQGDGGPVRRAPGQYPLLRGGGAAGPRRSGNGYRDYSEEDLRTLEKIKLLRRLGVTIEALRALRDGRAELSAVLDRRLAEVGGEQAALGRVERVCGDLRRTGTTFTGLDPGRYLADLDAPALPGEGGPWWEKASASALPETDRLPTVCSASRRLFARMFDEMLVRVLIASGLCLAGINLAAVSSFVVSLTAVVLLAFVEPLFLRLWGTTPGKALLGMRLTGPDGKNVPYTEGLARYFLMMWYGQGFEIPVWSLIQGYRSVRRCWNDEPQPWDVEVAYIGQALPGPVRRGPGAGDPPGADGGRGRQQLVPDAAQPGRRDGGGVRGELQPPG